MRKRVQPAKNMSENRMRVLSLALVQALSAGVVGSLATTAVHAQTAEKVEKLEITGSRVKRAEAEGALPVTVIERAELESSGQTTVAEYIRNISFSTAGNFRPQSGSSAQGFSEVNLRGLGSRRTLVLVDGRRIAKSPIVGDAVDMNSIPLAAVERIEILTDGASAVYGSDAIGGVVNVILRKSFQGVAVSVGATRVSGPKEGGDREEASAIMGLTGEKGRLIMGASMTQRDIIFTRDAYGTTGTRGASIFANNYYTLEGSPIAAVPGGCTNPNFFTISNGACRYDFQTVAADEAELSTKSFFARGEFNINADWTAFMTSSVNRVSSFGRYAPVPGFLEIRPGSVAHPWHADYPDPSLRTQVAADETILLAHRFAAGGNRDTFTETNMYDTLLGVKGSFRGVDVEAGLRKSTSKYIETGRGFVVQTLAEREIDNGNYNIFNPASTPADILARFTTNVGRDGRFDQTEQYANATFDLFKLAGGTARVFVGAERRKEVYEDLYDSLSEGGVILGSAGNSAAGSRKVNAYSAELVMPFTRMLEGTLAVRHEKYSDYGKDTSPKASIRFQPTSNLLFRASVGEGFSAPTLPQLTSKPAFSADSVGDTRNCIALGNPAADCTPEGDAYEQQVQATVISNPELTSEKAKQWSFGATWDVTPALSLRADLWNTKIEDVIVNVSAQTIVDRDNGIDPLPIPAGLSITRNSQGLITALVRGSTNEGVLEQRGVDASILFSPRIGKFGSLRHELRWSRVLTAESNGVDFNGSFNFPKDRASLNNSWKLGAFDAAWNVNMIGKHESSGRSAPAYITHDVQVGWHTPVKGLKLVAGAINLTEKLPKLVGYDGRAYSFYLYDGYGRQVYARAEMKF
jgi:iron complex outermembrane receptor protein